MYIQVRESWCLRRRDEPLLRRQATVRRQSAGVALARSGGSGRTTDRPSPCLVGRVRDAGSARVLHGAARRRHESPAPPRRTVCPSERRSGRTLVVPAHRRGLLRPPASRTGRRCPEACRLVVVLSTVLAGLRWTRRMAILTSSHPVPAGAGSLVFPIPAEPRWQVVELGSCRDACTDRGQCLC